MRKIWHHICFKWKCLEHYVHLHQKRYHQAHGFCHASYFSMVFLHGPYNVFAGAMLLLIIVGWLLHLED